MTQDSRPSRSVRGGSVWARKRDGWVVRVVFGRRGYVAYVAANDRDRGGLVPESDFREDFDWQAGR